MLASKNLSPNQLSALTAIVLCIPVGIAFFIVGHFWWQAIVIAIGMFLINYFLIRIVLQRFIYRKIKLIYKYIYQTKATKKEETYYKYILPQKGIDEVREDVEQWAIQRTAEIDTLKKAEAYRKEFLQNLAHEIKTPIFAVQGYVGTLLDGAWEDPETNIKFLQNTYKNIERMVHLVNNLDEIAKIEAGTQLLNKQNFIIQDIIKEVYETLSIKAGNKNIRLGIKKGCELPISVFADKEKVRQVITNLIVNAIKYGKEGGYVVASVYKTDGEHVLAEISDNGIGIAEEHLPRVFERFYRTDQARSRDLGGTGLGLAICKHIIEAHGQTIHVRSKPNIGTTIGFTLASKKDNA
ncbi:MAG: cell wall metabolism sensor histidine kinase WalK [Chitinophagaceae bacterium]|jgi:two-component system phosphate regulon sensor histidine kinase PhoR|nr:cell wall metabolism sensor histidine kinase WalK [Chitinophagaceae bacterium]